jgi:hypothetical protein
MQYVSEGAGLVAAVNALSLSQLTVNKRYESVLAEPLWRLRGLLIHLADHNNETGMNIQPELNYPGAGARVCLCRLIDSHDADSLAPCAPLVRHVI